jgi:cobalt-zinc-cadmium efflux system membrane fusion protein
MSHLPTLPASNLVLISIFSLTLAACGQHAKPGEEKTAEVPGKKLEQNHSAAAGKPSERKDASEDDDDIVRPRAEMLKRFEVGKVARATVERTQEIPGRLEVDEKRITRIGASVTGRVVEISADVGARVRAGEMLARISSTELTQAQLNYLRANAAYSLSERALDRAQQLFKADVISAAELQRRESEQSIARAELRAAADQLSLIGFDHSMQKRLRESGQLDPTVGIVATRGGVIVERKVSQGQVAQPGDALFTVADLNTVWAVGSLPEQAAGSVRLGQVVDVQVPALGEKRFRGRIVFVSDTIQPDTRTITVRTEVDNSSRELKPQMLATMRLFGETEQRLAIPDSAVVRDGDRDYVFLQRQEGEFKLIPVEVAASINGQRPVLRGLTEGQPIVMRGAFHLNNERKRAELE